MKKVITWLHSLPAIVVFLLFITFCSLVLVLSVRGLPGNPTLAQLNTLQWKDNGPLELSPERGRFALTYAIAENHSLQLGPDLARFTAPDVAYTNGTYVSLFPPGVSFVALGGYVLGKLVGLSQVGSFLSIAVFAILNMLLIRSIAIRVGANKTAATIAGFVFLFATPAFTYALTLYEHHITTFLLLSAIYLLLRSKSWWSLSLIWLLCGLSVLVDYPNVFFFLPVGLAALWHTVKPYVSENRVGITISPVKLLGLFSLLLPLALFCWYNVAAFDRPFQLAGTLDRALVVKPNGQPELESELAWAKNTNQSIQTNVNKDNPLNFFQSRLELSGFNELLFSSDRGVLTYTPIMLLSFIGVLLAVKRKMPLTGLLIATIGMIFLLYSMWGDPYGGWAFGGRYLIPAYALLSIFLGYFLTHWRRSNVFLLLFFILFSYSVSINTLGAITTSKNPPSAEAQQLSQEEHTDISSDYFNNISALEHNQVKSFVYQVAAERYMDGTEYYEILTLLLIMVGALLIIYLQLFSKEVTTNASV